jgi:steroid delta-isomerase-like uncharacterized protein
MSMHNHNQLADQYLKAFNNHDIKAFQPLLASNYVSHAPNLPPDQRQGFDGFRRWFEAMYTAFPDATLRWDDMISSEDKVAMRWTFTGTNKGPLQNMGLPATGKQVNYTGSSIGRIVDGKIAEMWFYPDALTMMRQLGLMPQMEQTGAR